LKSSYKVRVGIAIIAAVLGGSWRSDPCEHQPCGSSCCADPYCGAFNTDDPACMNCASGSCDKGGTCVELAPDGGGPACR
jgi:hypothetical protein